MFFFFFFIKRLYTSNTDQQRHATKVIRKKNLEGLSENVLRGPHSMGTDGILGRIFRSVPPASHALARLRKTGQGSRGIRVTIVTASRNNDNTRYNARQSPGHAGTMRHRNEEQKFRVSRRRFLRSASRARQVEQCRVVVGYGDMSRA